MTAQTSGRRRAGRMGAVVALVVLLTTAAVAVRMATAAIAPRATTTGPVVDRNVLATCDKALGVLERMRRTMAKSDAHLVEATSATAELGRAVLELEAISRSTADGRLPEALQDVSDAVSAYVTGMADSPRAADLRAVAVNAVSGFTKVCPVHNG